MGRSKNIIQKEEDLAVEVRFMNAYLTRAFKNVSTNRDC